MLVRVLQPSTATLVSTALGVLCRLGSLTQLITRPDAEARSTNEQRLGSVYPDFGSGDVARVVTQEKCDETCNLIGSPRCSTRQRDLASWVCRQRPRVVETLQFGACLDVGGDPSGADRVDTNTRWSKLESEQSTESHLRCFRAGIRGRTHI